MRRDWHGAYSNREGMTMAKANLMTAANAREVCADDAAREGASMAVDKAIASIKARGVNLAADVQHALVASSAFFALNQEHECAHLTRLMDAVIATKGLNANKLKGYLLDRLPIKYAKNKKGDMIFKWDRETEVDFDAIMAGLSEMAWYDYKPAAKEEEFDLAKLAKSFVKRVGSAADANDVTVTDEQLIAALKQALSEAHAAAAKK